MKSRKLKSPFSNQRGFTFVELMMVMGIMGMLSAIAVQQIKFNRENAYDSQSISMMRNLLVYAAVDEPVGGSSFGQGGGLDAAGYSEVSLPAKIYWNIINTGDDKWQFFFAHPSGKSGYYFWIPGESYAGSVDNDGSGNRSDKIFSDTSTNSYRKTASNASLP